MKSILSLVGFLILSIVIGYLMWSSGRYVNYKYSYESMVEETVRDMVKNECLKKN